MNALRFVAMLALVVLAPARTRAEPPERPSPAAQTSDRKVLRPGEVEIKGKVRKQSAPAITPPSMAKQQQPERDSFLWKIVEAVDKEPFREAGR
jgi:hypothetical protein